MNHSKFREIFSKILTFWGSIVRRLMTLVTEIVGVVSRYLGKIGALPRGWFVVLNGVYVVVTIIACSTLPSVSRVGAEQTNIYFKNFYKVEKQQDTNGTFDRNIRWSTQKAKVYLIRQPNGDGFTILSLLATTVVDNQSVELLVNRQRIAQFAVQPQLFRKYQTLVRVQWEPFRFWHDITLRNSELGTVAGRNIALGVGEVVSTPIHGTKYPHGMVIIYLCMVVAISTWVYVTFSPKVFHAVYFVLVALLVGFWFVMSNLQYVVLGITQSYMGTQQSLFLMGIDTTYISNLQYVVMDTQRALLLKGINTSNILDTQRALLLSGTVLNVLLVYYLYRYRVQSQQFMSNCIEEITHRLVFLNRYSAPVYARLRWLWQRPVLLYSMTIVLYFGGWLWNTQVLSPIDTKFAVNIPFTDDDYDNSGGFFSDYVIYSVPEQYLMVHEPRSTWLSTWTNKIELGREIRHYGFSHSYVLNWGMQYLFADPYVHFTMTFVLNIFLSGLFALLYVRRLLQHAGLALLAAYIVTASPFFFFWNTYMTFYTATTWGLALLYGIQRLRDTRDWKSVLFLMFATYSLFSLAYQQYIVWVAYMLFGYYVHVFWQIRHEQDKKWKFVGYSVLAVAVGASMTIPQYLDLLQSISLTNISVRNLEYFLRGYPDLGNVSRNFEIGLAYVLRDVLEPLTKHETALYHYRGANTTMFVFLLMLIGSIWRWRQTWGWSLWTVIAVVLSYSKTAFAFGYEQLHLPQFSSWLALYSGPTQHIPQMILAIYGVQVIIREPFNKSVKILFGMFALGMQLIIAATALRMTPNGMFTGMQSYVVFELIILLCVLLIALVTDPRIKWAVVYGVICMQTWVLLQPMLMTQPREKVYTTSATTEMIRKTLQPGERIVMIDNLRGEIANSDYTFNMVEPFGGNYNVMSEVANIGTYDALPSNYYVTLMKRFGNKYDGNASQNMYIRTIQLPMPANDQWMANIRTVVSKNPVYVSNFTLAFRTGGHIPFYVYTTPSTMGCCLQVPLTNVRMVESDERIDYWVWSPKASTNRQLQQRENQGDRFVVPVTESTAESIIVFSQIYHPQWYARVRTAAGWEDAATIVVNEAYQGVRVPVGTQEVVMEFRPWIYWGFIPNVFWLGCGLFIVGRWLWRNESLHAWVRHMRKGMA